MVPFLTLVAGLSQHAAEATSLLVILPTAVAGTLTLRRHGVGNAACRPPLRSGRGGRSGGRRAARTSPAGRRRSVSSSRCSSGRRRAEVDPRRRGFVASAGMTQVLDDRRALVDKLAATLQARVLSGELVSGTRLRQSALAEEFGVSRTPIREAPAEAAGKRPRRGPPASGSARAGSLGSRDS